MASVAPHPCQGWHQQWETQLHTLINRISTLEKVYTPGSGHGGQSGEGTRVVTTASGAAYKMSTGPPTSAEFFKLCMRVDLLDGKINIMKTELNKVLGHLEMQSNIMDHRLQKPNSRQEPTASTSASAAKCRMRGAELPNFEATVFGEPQVPEGDDSDDNDNWFPSGIEVEEYDGEEEDMVDIKPIVHPQEAYEEEEDEFSRDDPADPLDEFQDHGEAEGASGRPTQTQSRVTRGSTSTSKSRTTQSVTGKQKQRSKSQEAEDPTQCPPLDLLKLDKNPETNLFDCPMCHKGFKERGKVERHYVIHSGARPFQCIVCQNTYTRKDKLAEHYRKRHPDKIPPEYVVDKEKKEKKKYICQDCGRVSANRGNHELHLNACRGDRPFVCPHCGKGFTQPNALNTHVLCVHQKLKRFLCADCGKSFAVSSSYQRHVRMHRGERPFACNYCDKTFIDKGDLSRHHKAHQGIKTVKCHVCDLRFYKYYALRQHMQVHTGEKRFVCDLCGTTFGQAGSLNKHKLLHIKNGHVRIRKAFQRKTPLKPRPPKVAVIPELCGVTITPAEPQSQYDEQQYVLPPQEPLSHQFASSL